MIRNQADEVKININSDVYLEAIRDICNQEDSYLETLYEELSNISQIPMDKWKEPISTEDTFPLYLSGLNATEIANIRGVSRQSESNRLSHDFYKLLSDGFVDSIDEFKEDHVLNRRLLTEIIVKYYVYKASKEKDIRYLNNILGSRYATDRSKYIAYLKLGGNPKSFSLDSLDKRFTSPQTDSLVKEAYELMDSGFSNNEIAEKLNVKLPKIYYLRKKYITLKDTVIY